MRCRQLFVRNGDVQFLCKITHESEGMEIIKRSLAPPCARLSLVGQGEDHVGDEASE